LFDEQNLEITMNKSLYFLFVLTVITSNQLFGQLVVTRVNPSSVSPREEGFFYSLPRTGINVEIIVKKTQKIKGPYSEFADKYLGLTQVININSTEYEITSIRLSTFNEPDPSNYFFVKTSGKKKDSQAMELFLSDRGALIGTGNNKKSENDKQNKEIGGSGFTIPELPNPSLFERVDTVIRKISVDTTTIEQKVFKKIASAKTPDQKAKEAADFVLKLDESMFNLINGYQEVNYEKGTMEYMYKQMDELKNEYLELFKGVKGVTQETYSFRYIPQYNPEITSTTICKFSLSKGIMDKNSPTGDLIQMEISPLNNLSQVRSFVDQRNSVNKEEKGFYYSIPDEAEVVVKIGGQEKIESQFTINQFGVVTFLPASDMGNIELFNNTGGLKHVVIR
jgi:hypothetical protein